MGIFFQPKRRSLYEKSRYAKSRYVRDCCNSKKLNDQLVNSLQRLNVQKNVKKKEIEHLSLKGTFHPFRLKIKLILQRMNSIDESIILHALSNFGSIY